MNFIKSILNNFYIYQLGDANSDKLPVDTYTINELLL